MLDVNDKLVVFMHHKFVSRQLLKEFKGQALKIDGDISTNMRKDGTSPRQDVIDRFENDPKIQLLVANYEAGGYGLNLQFASEGGHLELMWNSSIHEQAIDRMHRMTQKDTVNEYFMIALDTIEETIADIIDTKSDVSGQIVDGEELQQENMLKKLIDKYREEE
jgi:SNF2 family DNA or RNA helicase